MAIEKIQILGAVLELPGLPAKQHCHFQCTMSHTTKHCFWPKINNQPFKKVFESYAQLSKSRQKLDVILEHKVVQKLKFSKNVNKTKCAPKIIFLYEKKY